MLIRVCNRPLQERRRTGLSREQISLWLAGYPKTPRLRRPILVTSGHSGVSGARPLYPQKADIGTQPRDVRFVPKADICSAAIRTVTR